MIKIVIVKDASAPGGQAFWSPDKGWHTLQPGERAVVQLQPKLKGINSNSSN
jgi:hypothetical protein